MDTCAAASTPATTKPVEMHATPSLEDLYRDYFAFVWRGARALRVPPHALDDVVQEVFVVVHGRLVDFEGRSSVRTWLAGIMLNVVRHHRRTMLRKSPHELSAGAAVDADTLASPLPSPDDVALANEATRLLDEILASLDEKKREILVLADLQELSAPEIADILDLPLNTVYSRLRLAREAFERLAARYRARDSRRMR